MKPAAVDLRDVGPAQQPTQGEASAPDATKATEHRTWVKRVPNGTMKILEGDRRHTIPQRSKEDILYCLDLMSCKQPLQFDWNIELYNT